MEVVGPPVGFVWTLPSDFYQKYTPGSTHESVTVETKDGSAGFVFIENVGAVDPTDEFSPPADPPAPGAQALATWLSTQPYLRTTTPVRTTVGGQPAWQMQARIGPEGSLPGTMASGLPGAFLVRVMPPVSDTDQLAAWFDDSYTTPSHLWLVDLPNGMIGYIEMGSKRYTDMAHTLKRMHFVPSPT